MLYTLFAEVILFVFMINIYKNKKGRGSIGNLTGPGIFIEDLVFSLEYYEISSSLCTNVLCNHHCLLGINVRGLFLLMN